MKSDSLMTAAIAVVRFMSVSGNLMSELFLVQMLFVTSETRSGTELILCAQGLSA
jgi:hypothetical protein